jgi:hypothetical protein
MVSRRVQFSHPPTRWQTFFTRPTLRLLRNRFPGDMPLARARIFGERALHEHRRPSSLPSLPQDDKFVLIPMHNIA